MAEIGGNREGWKLRGHLEALKLAAELCRSHAEGRTLALTGAREVPA